MEYFSFNYNLESLEPGACANPFKRAIIWLAFKNYVGKTEGIQSSRIKIDRAGNLNIRAKLMPGVSQEDIAARIF